MVRKILTLGTVGLVVAGLMLGRGISSYVTTAVDRVRTEFKRNVPIKFEIERARCLIKELGPEIERNMHLIAGEEVEIAKLERELTQNEKQLAQSREEIVRLKRDLETDRSHFVYAGRSYSPSEVKTDLANRFQHYQTSEATIDQLRQILRARENGLQAAREKLEAMLASRRQLAVEIENLEARMKMVEVAQTTSQFNFDDSQLARARDLLRDIGTRLEVTEKMMSQQIQLSDRIPLDAGEADIENVLDAVTRHFDGQAHADQLARTASSGATGM